MTIKKRKNGVGLLGVVNFGKVTSVVGQLCPTLCNPMDCSPPGFSVRGILLARILEWVAISFSSGSFWLWDQTLVFCIAGRFFSVWAAKEALGNIWGEVMEEKHYFSKVGLCSACVFFWAPCTDLCSLPLFLGKYMVTEWVKSLVWMPTCCSFWKNWPCCGSGFSTQCLFPNADWFHGCVPSLLFSLVGRESLAILRINRRWGLPYERPP